jgi:hypothetical protein
MTGPIRPATLCIQSLTVYKPKVPMSSEFHYQEIRSPAYSKPTEIVVLTASEAPEIKPQR